MTPATLSARSEVDELERLLNEYRQDGHGWLPDASKLHGWLKRMELGKDLHVREFATAKRKEVKACVKGWFADANTQQRLAGQDFSEVIADFGVSSIVRFLRARAKDAVREVDEGVAKRPHLPVLHRLGLSQIDGLDIKYVPSPALRKGVDYVKSLLKNARNMKASATLFAVGVSGSGKSRFGYELYHSLQDLTACGYLYFSSWPKVEAKPDGKIDSECRRRFADPVLDALQRQIFDLLHGRSPAGGDTLPSLADLCREWAKPLPRPRTEPADSDTPPCLIIHLDEFQTQPWLTALFLQCVVDANHDLQGTVVLVAVCSGLSSQETTALCEGMAFTGNKQTATVSLQFLSRKLRKQLLQVCFEKAATLVAGFAEAAWVKPTLKSDVAKMLLEDTGGWPLAVVNLGAALAFAVHGCVPADPLASVPDCVYAQVELKIVQDALWHKYPGVLSLAQSLGASDEDSSRKLINVAIAPFQVHKDEKVNGSTVEQVAKFGIVQAASAEEVGFFTVTASKMLLTVLVGKMLNDRLMPVPPQATLLTVRDYYGDTQEQVHVWSFIVNFNTLASLVAHGPQALTLSALRPGALVVGGREGVGFTVPRQDDHKPSRWLQCVGFAANHKLHLHEVPNATELTAGLFTTNHKGVDSWAKIDENTIVLLQTKGRVDVHNDTPLSPHAVAEILIKMWMPVYELQQGFVPKKKKQQQKQKQQQQQKKRRKQQKEEVVVDPDEDKLALQRSEMWAGKQVVFELLHSGTVCCTAEELSTALLSVMQGVLQERFKVPKDDAAATAHQLLAQLHFVVVAGNHFASAVGQVFGGMASRFVQRKEPSEPPAEADEVVVVRAPSIALQRRLASTQQERAAGASGQSTKRARLEKQQGKASGQSTKRARLEKQQGKS